ncbi:MAG: hypothetical protein NTV24_02890 [Candidatus Woesebacteria bacterium]|nr:hypothetical protein [Candidatus Woesebacteria bacterium]
MNDLSIFLTSGVIAALVSGLVTYYINQKLDILKRTMDARRELYTKLHELLSNFFTTESERTSNSARDKLLKYYREIQIWGSDEVVSSFRNLINAMIEKDSVTENRNQLYKEFVIAMRGDILGGKTKLTPNEIDIRGIIRKKH